MATGGPPAWARVEEKPASTPNARPVLSDNGRSASAQHHILPRPPDHKGDRQQADAHLEQPFIIAERAEKKRAHANAHQGKRQQNFEAVLMVAPPIKTNGKQVDEDEQGQQQGCRLGYGDGERQQRRGDDAHPTAKPRLGNAHEDDCENGR
jgi:hypothetical protein